MSRTPAKIIYDWLSNLKLWLTITAMVAVSGNDGVQKLILSEPEVVITKESAIVTDDPVTKELLVMIAKLKNEVRLVQKQANKTDLTVKEWHE